MQFEEVIKHKGIQSGEINKINLTKNCRFTRGEQLMVLRSLELMLVVDDSFGNSVNVIRGCGKTCGKFLFHEDTIVRSLI